MGFLDKGGFHGWHEPIGPVKPEWSDEVRAAADAAYAERHPTALAKTDHPVLAFFRGSARDAVRTVGNQIPDGAAKDVLKAVGPFVTPQSWGLDEDPEA